MSAFEDQPHHFVDWMQRQSADIFNGAPAAESAFVPRRMYGAYLRDLLGAVKPAPEMLHDEVVAIEVSDGLSRLRCASGLVLSANLVVLATGNDQPATPHVPGLKEAPFWRPDSWRMYARGARSEPADLVDWHRADGGRCSDHTTRPRARRSDLCDVAARPAVASSRSSHRTAHPTTAPCWSGRTHALRASGGRCQRGELAGRDRRAVSVPSRYLAVFAACRAAAVPPPPPPLAAFGMCQTCAMEQLGLVGSARESKRRTGN